MSTDLPFPVASHSKTFTAAVVLRLVEQGRLRLDDSVGALVPDVPSGMRDIQVGELLTHSAGVTRDGQDADFWQLLAAFPTRGVLLDLCEQPLGRHERFKYSNIGFALLGLVVEAAGGETYDAVARREVLAPLGLSSTTTDVAGRACPTGYSARRGGAVRRPLTLPSTGALAPATGYCSTAADLCRFASALCDGEDGLLAAETKRAMRRVAWVGQNGDADYGQGLDSVELADGRVHGHGGAFPGFITSTRFDAGESLVTVVLCNAIDAPSGDLTKTMQAVLHHAQGCSSGAGAPTAVTGRYTGLWGTQDVVRFGSQLVALDPELADPLERRIELEPIPGRPEAWTIVRSSGFGAPGEDVVFDGDSARFAGLTLQREAAW